MAKTSSEVLIRPARRADVAAIAAMFAADTLGGHGDTADAEVLPDYLAAKLNTTLYEALASEHAARMTAMHNATENAGEMISNLTLDMNKARQAAITTEISEIVSGAESIKG